MALMVSTFSMATENNSFFKVHFNLHNRSACRVKDRATQFHTFRKGKTMTTILENNSYSFSRLETEDAILFTWKHIPGLEVSLFKAGLQAFAELCRQHNPAKGIIDATALDQQSAAVAWLRGQSDAEAQTYDNWWLEEIVPKYNAANLTGLAVATGDPSAPGELPNLPEAVKFKVGYFPDIAASVDWQP